RVVEPKGSMITFVAADVDGWYETLRARGVAIDAPPHTLEQFGIYTFFVRDPNGYVIEFQQFL
ncbi:MAG: VOC family protein, partial [Hyphomicrobiales bacterium]